jgi:hypothetical protein
MFEGRSQRVLARLRHELVLVKAALEAVEDLEATASRPWAPASLKATKRTAPAHQLADRPKRTKR